MKEQRWILSKDIFHRVKSVVVCSTLGNVCDEEFKPKDLPADMLNVPDMHWWLNHFKRLHLFLNKMFATHLSDLCLHWTRKRTRSWETFQPISRIRGLEIGWKLASHQQLDRRLLHPTLCRLVDRLRKEQADNELLIDQADAGVALPPTKKRYEYVS